MGKYPLPPGGPPPLPGRPLPGGPPGPLPEGPPPPPGMHGRRTGPFPFLLKAGKWLPVMAIPAKVSAAIVCDMAEL